MTGLNKYLSVFISDAPRRGDTHVAKSTRPIKTITLICLYSTNCSHKLSSYSEHQLRRRDIYVKNYRGTGYLGGGLTRYGIFQKIRTHWVRVVVQ